MGSIRPRGRSLESMLLRAQASSSSCVWFYAVVCAHGPRPRPREEQESDQNESKKKHPESGVSIFFPFCFFGCFAKAACLLPVRVDVKKRARSLACPPGCTRTRGGGANFSSLITTLKIRPLSRSARRCGPLSRFVRPVFSSGVFPLINRSILARLLLAPCSVSFGNRRRCLFPFACCFNHPFLSLSLPPLWLSGVIPPILLLPTLYPPLKKTQHSHNTHKSSAPTRRLAPRLKKGAAVCPEPPESPPSPQKRRPRAPPHATPSIMSPFG